MTAVEIKRQYVKGTLSMATGAAVTGVLNITTLAFGAIQLPAAITGTLKWQVSIDEVTWTDGDAITFVASASLKIPDDVMNFPAARIAASSNQAADRSFGTFVKG